MHHLTIVPQCLLRESFRSHIYQKLQSNRHHRCIIRVRFQIHTIATGILFGVRLRRELHNFQESL